MQSRFLHWALAAALAGTSFVATPRLDAQVQIQFRLGSRDHPLRGRQFEIMRRLAHRLDEQTQQARNEAGQSVSYGASSRRVASALSDFGERTSRFHERMDNYLDRPWDVPREIDSLDRAARRVSAVLNRSRTSGDVASEWNDVVDVLNRMKRLLSGYDVDLPPAYGNTEVVTPGVPVPAPVPYLTGAELARFRDLVRDLDDSLARVRDAADRYGRRGYEGAQEVFANIQTLADEASRLRQRSEADRLDPRDLRPSVERLADTARRTDESIRRYDMLPGVRNEWQQSIATLDQMNRLVH